MIIFSASFDISFTNNEFYLISLQTSDIWHRVAFVWVYLKRSQIAHLPPSVIFTLYERVVDHDPQQKWWGSHQQFHSNISFPPLPRIPVPEVFYSRKSLLIPGVQRLGIGESEIHSGSGSLFVFDLVDVFGESFGWYWIVEGVQSTTGFLWFWM